MRRDIAAKRYAEAVFQIARDQQTLDAWQADLQTIGATFGDPEVLGLLESARIPWDNKAAVLSRTLRGISPLAMNYARLLVQRRRVYLAPQVAEDYQTLADDYRGVAHAEVTTAIDVTNEERQMIAERLSLITNKRVDVQTHTDPGIIGGMVARVGDQLIDGSTRTRLRTLRQRLEAAR